MATHSSILAWEISWTEEPGRLQSMGLKRIRQDLVTKQQPDFLVFHSFLLGEEGKVCAQNLSEISSPSPSPVITTIHFPNTIVFHIP